MFFIKTFNKISNNGLNCFSRENFEIASEINRADALLLRSHKLAESDLNEGLKAIARAGAGVNNIPVQRCSERGVVVFNTPGANANAVKEIILAGLLLGARDLVGGLQFVKSMSGLNEAEMHTQAEQGKKQFSGCELHGKTLGVVGLGAIGAQVANMALELGMRVIGYDPALSVESAWRLSSRVEKAENLASLLNKSDFVTLHVPAIEATKGMISNDAIKQFQEGAILLNFARETIVDLAAVTAALNTGALKKYITDFPAPELIGRDDTLIFPHLGASTQEAEDNCATMAANQLIDFLMNGNIKNSVNFPSIYLERSTGYRLTFCNENVPKVLSNVLSLLADRNINVIDMLNKSRDQIAYNILDIEEAPSDELLDEIRQVQHVINVRLIE
ncbi:phosphoglycerate dehydrogenase [Gynuella sunshinyii]|uniref:D-3-phosphoglycerate dehydrogenase n=1 Tax=Gynuella sunshinyii YC6258 TaxID=1445510 RepID=A0A0C5W407_9GAMM|nr:phosphoglycerate dehydrogenase [Gynuella sunshinyii]AJQ97354.1 phosphoglycerate dehydrogenase and related dehydrogenase [Gynuella sunshinyii YC6258]